MARPIFEHKLRLKTPGANVPTIASPDGFSPVQLSGHEYYPTWGGNGVSTISLVGAGAIGTCLISPISLDTTKTFNRLRFRVNNASNSVHRGGIYYLSNTTWLPTALAVDAGTMTWTGAGADRTLVISFKPTQPLCGLAMLYESRTDAVNPSIPSASVFQAGVWPLGYNAGSATLNDTDHYKIISTGNAAGAMPAASTFSQVVETTNTQVQYLIGIRVV